MRVIPGVIRVQQHVVVEGEYRVVWQVWPVIELNEVVSK